MKSYWCLSSIYTMECNSCTHIIEYPSPRYGIMLKLPAVLFPHVLSSSGPERSASCQTQWWTCQYMPQNTFMWSLNPWKVRFKFQLQALSAKGSSPNGRRIEKALHLWSNGWDLNLGLWSTVMGHSWGVLCAHKNVCLISFWPIPGPIPYMVLQVLMLI